jgi:diguanylate cyclase (GGDEF)-like protein
MQPTPHPSLAARTRVKGLDLLKGDGLASAVLGALPDATAVLDRSGSIVAVNRTWTMFALDNEGSAASTGINVNYLEVCDRAAATGCAEAGPAAAGIRVVLSGETVQSEVEYPCPSPTLNRWFLLRVTPLSGASSGAVVSHINITRRKMAEKELAHEAAHDPLTGLANRTLFNVRLTSALTRRAGRQDVADVGILYIDLDQFKLVNDTYGHNAGDEVLVSCAQRLQSQIRLQDTASRLGGDEFAAVVPRITAVDLAALARRLTQALSEPYLVHGKSARVPASVGAYLAKPGELGADVLQHADDAMYAVKESRPDTSRTPVIDPNVNATNVNAHPDGPTKGSTQ